MSGRLAGYDCGHDHESRTPSAEDGCRTETLPEFYPDGFRDLEYVALERDCKWEAHLRWNATLGRSQFAEGRYDWLYGRGRTPGRFDRWRDVVADLPRRQTRVLTWPILTTFGFLARPRVHLMLEPMVTRRAAREYGFDFEYSSQPRWRTYESLLRFATTVRADLDDWKPRDMIDIQSFIWVLSSAEYD